jgi:hypothetical protein
MGVFKEDQGPREARIRDFAEHQSNKFVLRFDIQS